MLKPDLLILEQQLTDSTSEMSSDGGLHLNDSSGSESQKP